MQTKKMWFKLAGVIADNLPTASQECPECGQAQIDFQYVGERNTMRGFLCIWCVSCLHGIHISGVRIPEHADCLQKNQVETVKKRIPNFKVG
ncbi:MAG: hypothetical protein CVU89_14490 [Firmicutes bacterium HGW-Firmicutes-14]|nr:MAG: hypothetical protein CVU89_14490 [Firmicutes bacterium HGW-Firmicutes-14]